MTTTVDTVRHAAGLARNAHAGQTDKVGQPYIDHPAEVAYRLRDADPIVQVVAWLHDVVEDTDVTLDEIRVDFGDEVAEAVDAISHRKGERRDDYYARVKANPIASQVKEADLGTNTDPWRTRMLDVATRTRLSGKYVRAYEVLELPQPEPLLPDGRIPVNVGDFAARGDDHIIVAWVGKGPEDVVAVFTKLRQGDGQFRGTATTSSLLEYHGFDSEHGHVFSLPSEWVVVDPMYV